MRILAPVSTALFAIACATPSSPSSSSSSESAPDEGAADPSMVDLTASETAPDDPFAAAFVSAHNRVRANVSPLARPPLPNLEWADMLAGSAEAWAARCRFEHSETNWGENLAARTDQADPATIVADWAAEAEHYDYAKDRCKSGQVCGHYTQVVWRTTEELGCAVARCNGGGPFGDGEWFFWVCHYSDAGNFRGERPY